MIEGYSTQSALLTKPLYSPRSNYSLTVWNRFRDIDLPPQTHLFAQDRISPLLMQRLLTREPMRQTAFIPVSTRYGQELYVPMAGNLLAVRTMEEQIQVSFSPILFSVGEREFFAYKPAEDENHRPTMEKVPGIVTITATERGLTIGFTPHEFEEVYPWGGIDHLPAILKGGAPTATLPPLEEVTERIFPEEQWGYANARRGFAPEDYLPQRVEYNMDKPINPNSTIINSPQEAMHRRAIFASGPTPILSLLAREHAQISQQKQEANEPLPPPMTRHHVAIADGKRYPVTLHFSYQEASDTHPGRLLYAVQEPEGR